MIRLLKHAIRYDQKSLLMPFHEWFRLSLANLIHYGQWGTRTVWELGDDGWVREVPLQREPSSHTQDEVGSFPAKEAPGAVNPSRSEPEGLGIYCEDADGKSGKRRRRWKVQASVVDERQEKLW